MHFSATLFQINGFKKTFSPCLLLLFRTAVLGSSLWYHFTEEMRSLCMALVAITVGATSRSPLILFQALLLYVCFAAESWHVPPSQTALGMGTISPTWGAKNCLDFRPLHAHPRVTDGCGSTKAQLLFFKVWFTLPSTLQDGAESGSSVKITHAWLVPLSHSPSAASLVVDPESTPFNKSCGPKSGSGPGLGSSAVFLALGIRTLHASPWQHSWECWKPKRWLSQPLAWGLFGFPHS